MSTPSLHNRFSQKFINDRGVGANPSGVPCAVPYLHSENPKNYICLWK